MAASSEVKGLRAVTSEGAKIISNREIFVYNNYNKIIARDMYAG